jgi:hypothetical protein
MMLVLFKLVTAPTLILVATLVSRRFGHATGGWLVGLPLTSGPIAVFLALEQGPQFAQAAANGSLEGTVAQACFAVAYVYVARAFAWWWCLAAASVAFFVAGLLLAPLSLPLMALIAIACLGLAASLRVIGKPTVEVLQARAPRWDLPVRMFVATTLVIVVTTAAAAIGPGLSGLVATFPLFAVVLTVFAHRHHGRDAARSVLRGLLIGLFGFVGFFASVASLVTSVGIASAFAIALGVNLAIHAVAYRVAVRR